MPKPKLHQFHQSGATMGQVPTWDGTEWVPADQTGGGGGAQFVPLTTEIDGAPALVWDDDNQLVMTEVTL